MLSRRDRLALSRAFRWAGYSPALTRDGKILCMDGKWRDDPRYDPDAEGPVATVTPIHGGTPDGRATASASPTADDRTVHESQTGKDDLIDDVIIADENGNAIIPPLTPYQKQVRRDIRRRHRELGLPVPDDDEWTDDAE